MDSRRGTRPDWGHRTVEERGTSRAAGEGMERAQVAANDLGRDDQDEAFSVRRPVARDSLSE